MYFLEDIIMGEIGIGELPKQLLMLFMVMVMNFGIGLMANCTETKRDSVC